MTRPAPLRFASLPLALLTRALLTRALIPLGLLLLTLLLPPGAQASEGGPVVLAAASLTEALQAAGAAWAAKGHPAPTFSFDASSKLAKQVEAGAPADLYLSADAAWMDYLDQRGLVDHATRVDLLGNRLVVVVPASSPLSLTSAQGLATPAVRRLALAGENVPAGSYGRAALRNLGAWDAVKDRVVSGDNVRTVLGWVAAGEADAGLVYATDAKVEPRVKVALGLPDGSHAPIVYPAAVVKGAAHAKEASDFLAFCRSAEGMAVFTAAGFRPPLASP